MTRNDTTYTTIRTHAALRLLLLLLMMTVVSGAWAEGVTTRSYYYGKQDYESATDASSWSASSYSAGLSLQTGDATYGQYIQYQNGSGQNGPRTARTNFYSTDDFYGGDHYVMEFDAAVSSQSGYESQPTELVVASDGYSLKGNEYFTNTNSTNKNYLFLLRTDNDKTKNTTYYINGGSTGYTIAAGSWFHVKLTVDISEKKVKYALTGAITASGTYTITDTSSPKAKAIVVGLGRNSTSAYVNIDNIEIYKLGWDITLFVEDLTNGDNDNKISSSECPKLYNPDNAAVTYSYDNSVLQNTWDNPNYPPRMKTTGNGTVTATIGTGADAITSSYTYIVNSNIGGGTYDPTTKTYTFDRIGIINSKSISDVPGITMSFNGGPTALVVDRGGTKYLKVIDANGYSHPNLNGGDIPPENNWGGTFYKFTPSVDGKLSFTGSFVNMKLYASDNTSTPITKAASGTSATNIELETGKTYYLYNADSSTPLLHSFTYISNASSLTFRNPLSAITVDIAEGSYTNPAISAYGLPISYEITSGGEYVEGWSSGITGSGIDATGKVVFKKGLINFSYSITVKASTAASGGIPAAAVSYTIQLVRNTWIFNDADYWTTTFSDMGTTFWTVGTNEYIDKKYYNWESLKIGTGDGTELPETNGLLFYDWNKNNRIFIAPKDAPSHYVAMKAARIGIDDVKAGQTVTVDWYANRGDAIMNIEDAGGEGASSRSGGVVTHTATVDGRVTLTTNSSTSYIRSIKLSTPTRAIGTLTYPKAVFTTGETISRTGYTITDETGTADLHDFYYQPSNYTSSNTDVATVDGSGNITAIAEGVAIITATATAKNSVTHQESVTLLTTIEVVTDGKIRIRTIDIDDLLYTTDVSAANGLDRTIPGFTLAFSGGDGVKCNNASSLLLRVSGSQGKMVITPRVRDNENVTITKAVVNVKSATGSPQWKVNNGNPQSATTGGISLDGLSANSLTLECTSGSIEITDIKIYYQCPSAENADYCLDETKVAPTFAFNTAHYMRIPADGRAFAQTPTLTAPSSFNISYSYNSNNTAIATIGSDGTNGQLVASGEAIMTAAFHETTYFAAASATYSVSNTLLPGESYDDISIAANQFIHIEGSAEAAGTPLTLSGTHGNSLTFGTTPERKNTYADANGTVTLSNNTAQHITIYSVHVVTKNLRAWLYYNGQEENYMEQVQFKGFSTGSIMGFHIIDIGDPENPIDLTDAYMRADGSNYSTSNATALPSFNSSDGSSLNPTVGQADVTLTLTNTGAAEGYDATCVATAHVRVMDFGANTPVTWSFINNVDNADNTLGTGWTYDDRGFQYGYFADYSPILNSSGNVYAPDDAKQMHGVMLKDEFRWYADDATRGLRANLSQPKSSIKFPVKKGMEIVINVASSSADVNNTITNVTDVNGGATNTLYIQDAGASNPINAYFLAASDGVVELKSADKVGMYLKSITLRVPEIHFTDDIVTVLNTPSSTVTNATTNVPNSSLSYLSYEITSGYTFDESGNESVVADVSTLASIDNIPGSPTKGRITLTSTPNVEGRFTVKVTNTNPSPTNVEPLEGTYTVYAVDFRFDPNEETLNLDDNYNKEKDFSRRPIGINKVITPITYSFEIPSGSNAKAMMSQSTNVNPALTTYLLTAYNRGAINVIAQTGRITTQCTLNVTGHTFGKSVDVLSESDIASNSYTYEINLPEGYDDANLSQWTLTSHFSGDFPTTPTVTANTSSGKLVISNLYGTSATARNHGAIRVIATHNNWNDYPADDNYTQFILTLSYPASSGKKWDLYRSTTGLKAQTDHDNKIGDYSGTHLNPQTVSDYVITGTNGWTTDTSWKKIYRNGDKEPRWAYKGSVKCDNAFIIEETAGLQIETPKESFYVDNNATASYYHIGLHSHSTVTIPKLKQGDFVRLNMSRVIPNNGAIIEAKNVTDLAGTPVTEKFTITRSQIDYKENGVLATDENGSRIIPGYYTFIVENDGDASFTLSDEGYLDLLSVEIYDKDAALADTYLGTKDDNGYQHTMTKVKLSSSGYPFAPTTMLKENDAQELVNLSFCHPMWSTSVGPCDYELRGVNPITDNLNATMENIGWYSNGGVYYVDGLITVNEGYGKVTVRMNNYTSEGKYLIGYTPDYTLTVGHLPHQDYPYTWNFTNISGGTVKGDYNNAYNSVNGDASTWEAMGDNVFELDTDTEGGSFYVPGATLVTTPRDLGMKGTKTELDAAGTGCDEFNGLGVQGHVMFKTEGQASAARNDAPRRTASVNISLLEYSLDNLNYNYGTELPAGNGTIKFGANKREVSNSAACGYIYRLDDGNSKYIKLTPMRPFRTGDIIKVKAQSGNLAQSGNFKLCLIENKKDAEAKATFTCTDSEAEYSYTVTEDDGINGSAFVCIYRSTTTTLVSEISITGSSALIGSKMLYAVTPTTITIPDLNADGKQDWIYIKASKEPTAVTNATKVSSGSDGQDAASGVYKYKVTAAGKSDVTFNGDTEIDQIGVTHILKQMTKAGDKAWATESRDHSIDHSLTGYFTSNDVNAYTVTKVDASSTANKTTVKLNAITEDGYVPEETGLVMRLDGLDISEKQAAFATTNGYDGTADTGRVPLFYPAMTTAQTSKVVDFPTNNLMYKNLSERILDSETETIDAIDYTRFILAKRYAEWRKKNDELVHPEQFESKDAAVFYRLHQFKNTFGSETADELNTLGPNKAYLLLKTSELPDAIWKGDNTLARGYVGILGVSDMEEDFTDKSADRFTPSEKTYNLRGQLVNTDSALPPGVYIRNGKKIIVK